MNDFQEEIAKQIQDSIDIRQKALETLINPIEQAVEMLIDCFLKGHKVLVFGNGGSAADAQHLAAELVNKLNFERAALPAIALTTDTSVITSIGNDSSFDHIFEKQIEALGEEGDVAICLTTSDISEEEFSHSVNIALGLKVARRKGLKTLGFVSEKSQNILQYLDLILMAPSKDSPRIQEIHQMCYHIICDLVEQTLFKNLMQYLQQKNSTQNNSSISTV